jgi:hypothetical protein
MRRYLNIYKRHTVLFAILLVLIIISSIASGSVATFSSIAAGLLMIILGVGAALWILKTPTKKPKEEAA